MSAKLVSQKMDKVNSSGYLRDLEVLIQDYTERLLVGLDETDKKVCKLALKKAKQQCDVAMKMATGQIMGRTK